MRYAAIVGTGGYLPKNIVNNHDLAKKVDTSDEWIRRRVGINERRRMADDESIVDMAEHASREALERSSLSIDDIDFIIVATSSSDCYFPGVACQLQSRLNPLKHMPAVDLNAACSGFIYGLGMADPLIRSGSYNHILVVGVDAYSQLMDWQDRSTCVLFGDGAGAVVLSPREDSGIHQVKLSANGKYHDCLFAVNELDKRGRPKFIQMQGNETFRLAVHHLGGMLNEAIEGTPFTLDDIDWLVPHQANLRIISAAAKRLNLPMDRVITTVTEHGNTVAASIPLALHHAEVNNKIKRGQLVLLEGFGAGFTWGSCLLEY